jgi:hypothetical protein
MLNQCEFRQSSQKRRVTLTPQKAARAALDDSETAPEITAMNLLIELDRIGRIVREIERELSQWDAHES